MSSPTMMPVGGEPTWRASEAELLLREFTHRTGNQIAAALAALNLAKAGRTRRTGMSLLDDAIARLEHFGDVHRLLAAPVRSQVDLGPVLDALCRGLLGAHPGAAESRATLMLPTMEVDGAVARRLALIAAELVSNALKYALDRRRGHLRVALCRNEGEVVLEVADDGPGVRGTTPEPGTGFGRGIVSELVERGGGAISVETGRLGTTVVIAMPLSRAERTDVEYPF